MVKARKYVVKNYFKGVPKREEFEVVEYELPPLKDGEILIKTEWISVDPYHRAHNKVSKIPYDQFGLQVGVVKESKDPKFPVGTKVLSHKGWCDYTIAKDAVQAGPLDHINILPDFKGLSPSLALGALGLIGLTAYAGFLEICKPKAGETVVVTAAAGAVGSLVGQIAKIKDCKVIGFAGSDDKVEWLEKELGFDRALNYKTVDVAKALKKAAPKGVDCYFDNVGGEISSIIINQMNKFGRVSVCGSISSYNEEGSLPKATILQPAIIFQQLIIRGFGVSEWSDRLPEVIIPELVDWIKSGQLKVAEHVTDGFDNIFDAFVGMLAGENKGKALVKV